MTSPRLNIILINERLKAFPLRSRIRQGYLFTPDIRLKVLTRAVRQERNKRYQNWKILLYSKIDYICS